MTDGNSVLLSVVIPAHNEAAGLAASLMATRQVLESCCTPWEIVVVDDGSCDGTFDRLRELASADDRIKGILFSRNFGKEAALLAGLDAAKGKAVITMDADLQHPPRLIPQMLEVWRKGADVVDCVKRSREQDSLLIRARASIFNTLLSRLGGINLDNSSDFKLLDRVVVDTITQALPEKQRFFRGLSDWVGYRHVSLPFDVEARTSGTGKWSLFSLVGLATTALVSFTSAPLRIVTVLGFTTLIFGFLVALEALVGWLQGVAVSGFTTIIITLLVIGSFIMISLGVIGEYIAKIYDEIKKRPVYLVESRIGIEPSQKYSHHGTTAKGTVDAQVNR